MRICLATLAGVLLLAGCELMPPYQPVDYKKTPVGKVVLRDTPRTWSVMIESTERAIQNEASGKPPTGGFKNWNELWVWNINKTRDGGQENPEKYVAYIVQRRRDLGLPEIVFPPNT